MLLASLSLFHALSMCHQRDRFWVLKNMCGWREVAQLVSLAWIASRRLMSYGTRARSNALAMSALALGELWVQGV